MDNQYEEIQKRIYTLASRVLIEWGDEKIEALTPELTDRYLTFFSTMSAFMEEDMGKLEIEEAQTWLSLRSKYETVNETERAWTRSESGIRQIELKHKMKAIDKIIASLKAKLKRFNNESFNYH